MVKTELLAQFLQLKLAVARRIDANESFAAIQLVRELRVLERWDGDRAIDVNGCANDAPVVVCQCATKGVGQFGPIKRSSAMPGQLNALRMDSP